MLLVAEPTPFGLNDLRLTVEILRLLGLPCGVVVNRDDGESGPVRDYCAAEDIEVLASLPDDRAVAEACSRGELAVHHFPQYRQRLEELLGRVEDECRP